jgi:hypothetical protein
VFYCIEKKFGVSGTMEITTVYCTNQLSSWVEAFFIIDIIVLWVLACLWILDLIFTNLFLMVFPLYHPSKKQMKPNCYRFQEFSMSKKLLVVLLSQNLETLFWDDVVNAVLNTRKPSNIRRSKNIAASNNGQEDPNDLELREVVSHGKLKSV